MLLMSTQKPSGLLLSGRNARGIFTVRGDSHIHGAVNPESVKLSHKNPHMRAQRVREDTLYDKWVNPQFYDFLREAM
ncbi:hypothetical protein RSOLAG1IB_12274 [Rhizoctonia solani AG-1 IB]|uniref:Uncharacterized protein n=1 Tax=Thanatephorus cucumeris (strain AG1-IB / isolate 7/3/14) TaxID=1108050 RepID=A0A0B7FUU5_THACB|nr:hypothetical protein RSOLAG1IB_12274 [Rhizoctonia solani AG-1 IB]